MIKGIRRAEEGTPQCGVPPAPGSAGKSQRQRGAQAGRRPRGESLSLRRVGASSVSLAPAFSLHDKSRSALTPLLLLSAKGSARLACSLASALTTARHRCQPFAGAVRKAHASHGPSALHMIKGIRRAEEGTPRCGVLPPRGARARASASAERKQAAARAENPFLCAASEQALYRLLRLFHCMIKAGARSHRCSSFPQKVPLGSPARLQARSQRLAIAANLFHSPVCHFSAFRATL